LPGNLLKAEHQIIRELSDKIVAAQGPIRILDAIKWDDNVRQDFFKNRCQKLPMVDEDYYLSNPLPFDPSEKAAEFRNIIREAKNRLGQYSNITVLIERRCEDYCKAIEMLAVRGTPLFSYLAMELYGSPDDAFYPGGPKLSDLGSLLGDTLKTLTQELSTEADVKRHTAAEAMMILQERLSNYFSQHSNKAMVKLSDDIVADAAAGADVIKLNQNVRFSDRDLRYLEVHEGWVHLGTTLNGAEQPLCTFLSKGSPSSSVTQEGLAIINEIFTFSSYPSRLQRITNRVAALELVRKGADFIDIFRFFREQGFDENDCYNYCVRIFRGSLPAGSGPFTKDLSYAKGFLLIYNYIRLAVQQGLVQHIPVFFVGKTLIEDIQTLTDLLDEGIVTMPMYMPPHFSDLAALSCWMSMSLFLNKFDLETVAKHYRLILHV